MTDKKKPTQDPAKPRAVRIVSYDNSLYKAVITIEYATEQGIIEKELPAVNDLRLQTIMSRKWYEYLRDHSHDIDFDSPFGHSELLFMDKAYIDYLKMAKRVFDNHNPMWANGILSVAPDVGLWGILQTDIPLVDNIELVLHPKAVEETVYDNYCQIYKIDPSAFCQHHLGYKPPPPMLKFADGGQHVYLCGRCWKKAKYRND